MGEEGKECKGEERISLDISLFLRDAREIWRHMGSFLLQLRSGLPYFSPHRNLRSYNSFFFVLFSRNLCLIENTLIKISIADPVRLSRCLRYYFLFLSETNGFNLNSSDQLIEFLIGPVAGSFSMNCRSTEYRANLKATRNEIVYNFLIGILFPSDNSNFVFTIKCNLYVVLKMIKI